MLELDSPSIIPEDIGRCMTDANILYIDGGNTFYLQHHILRTNFWQYFKGRLDTNGAFLYIGASAGAIVVGQSIETAYWKGWDDPLAAGEAVEWTEERKRGAGLVHDECFFMHYDESSHREMVESNGKRFIDQFRVRTVPDNAALIYSRAEPSHGDGYRFVLDCQYDNFD